MVLPDAPAAPSPRTRSASVSPDLARRTAGPTTREEAALRVRELEAEILLFSSPPPRLAKLSDGFNGSELEEAVISGLYEAFPVGRELSASDIARAIRDTVPLSITMAEKVEAIREWGRTRARGARPRYARR